MVQVACGPHVPVNTSFGSISSSSSKSSSHSSYPAEKESSSAPVENSSGDCVGISIWISGSVRLSLTSGVSVSALISSVKSAAQTTIGSIAITPQIIITQILFIHTCLFLILHSPFINHEYKFRTYTYYSISYRFCQRNFCFFNRIK